MDTYNNLSEELEALLESATEVNLKIPKNSPTISMNHNNSRFSSAIWYEEIQRQSITVIGVGGIGSFLVFLLSRVNPACITIYDMDMVEDVNMSGQLYSKKDVGIYKVQAIRQMIDKYSNYAVINSHTTPYDHNSAASDIMICGLDNMKTRSVAFNNWVKHIESYNDVQKAKCLFIDARLAAEELQVFCIKGDDDYNIKRYQDNYLFSDREAEETLCSYKQTSFMANMIASIMCNLFVNFVANQCGPIIDRDLPFFTYYSAETMFFKTEA